MKELHEKYGRLMIQLEIIQAQVNEVKKQIAQKMNQPPQPKQKK